MRHTAYDASSLACLWSFASRDARRIMRVTCICILRLVKTCDMYHASSDARRITCDMYPASSLACHEKDI